MRALRAENRNAARRTQEEEKQKRKEKERQRETGSETGRESGRARGSREQRDAEDEAVCPAGQQQRPLAQKEVWADPGAQPHQQVLVSGADVQGQRRL